MMIVKLVLLSIGVLAGYTAFVAWRVSRYYRR
jgi:hypothetical protein